MIVSLTYGAGGLDGSPLPRGTNGHLLVVVGFTDTGDVVVNDPAAPDRAGVRRTYDRGQFENAWLKRGSAGGSGGRRLRDPGRRASPPGAQRRDELVTGHVSFRAWRTGDHDAGVHLGTAPGTHGLELVEPAGVRTYVDPHADAPTRRTYAWGAWLSPAVTPGHPFTELVPSWNARTPGDSWVEVEARTSVDGVHWSRWWSLGCWAETDGEIHPTSVPGQGDDTTSVSTDVLAVAAGRAGRPTSSGSA